MRVAGWVDEHQRAVLGVRVMSSLVPSERLGNAGIERPRSRVVRLVPVEPNRAAHQIEVGPRERHGFALPHAFAREEAPQQPKAERHVATLEQPPILLGVELGERFALPAMREEPDGDRARGNDSKRVDRELEQPREQRADAAAGEGRHACGQPAHEPVGYLYRHSLELHLKHALRLGLSVGAGVDESKLGRHDLAALWREFRKAIKATWPTLEDSHLDRQEPLVLDLHNADSTGQNLRYSRDRAGNFTMDAYPDAVELRELQRAFAELDELLSICSGVLMDLREEQR